MSRRTAKIISLDVERAKRRSNQQWLFVYLELYLAIWGLK